MAGYEVEVKAWLKRDRDTEVCRQVLERESAILEKRGALKVGTLTQRDLYFNHPSRDFSKTDEALRVRIEGEKNAGSGKKASLTYKGERLSLRSKSRTELNVPLGLSASAEDAEKLLELLGFSRAGETEKDRTVFRLSGLEVSLDLVKGLGAFVEVESISDDIQGEENRILVFMEEMGWADHERRSYLELLKEEKY